jgi:hypothetical protein
MYSSKNTMIVLLDGSWASLLTPVSLADDGLYANTDKNVWRGRDVSWRAAVERRWLICHVLVLVL